MPNSEARSSDFDLGIQSCRVHTLVHSRVSRRRCFGGARSASMDLRRARTVARRIASRQRRVDRWVDGIFPAYDMVPDALKVTSPVELTVRGSALWGKGSRGTFWIEPFFASVRISENTDAIVSYSLKFADAARGLGTVPYGKHLRRPDWFFPVEWLFTFSKEAVEGEVSRPA